MVVKEWLPSEPILQREFVAFPTCVDWEEDLSILNDNRRTVDHLIEEILRKKYKTDQLKRRDAMDWKKDDPCFVHFPADGRLYRATIYEVYETAAEYGVSLFFSFLFKNV